METRPIPFPLRVLRFLVYSNIFIAICAALMTIQTVTVLLQNPPDFYLINFVFFATVCSYSFHWLLTADTEPGSDRIAWLYKNRWVHGAFLVVGLVGSAYYGLILVEYWKWLLPAGAATFLYSAPKIPHPAFRSLRKIAYGKTIFLAFLWMYVTTALPLVMSGRGWQPSFTWFVVSRFFFIYSICVLFDYRDRDYDRTLGIRSLITWLDSKGVAILFYISLIISAIFTLLLSGYDFNLLLLIILLLPSAITAGLYNYAVTHSGDLLYYLVLDGLMALSSAITMLPII
jgi:4-hydroxybenzoate polyprenyltransferase